MVGRGFAAAGIPVAVMLRLAHSLPSRQALREYAPLRPGTPLGRSPRLRTPSPGPFFRPPPHSLRERRPEKNGLAVVVRLRPSQAVPHSLGGCHAYERSPFEV